jgi:hypothetical protein
LFVRVGTYDLHFKCVCTIEFGADWQRIGKSVVRSRRRRRRNACEKQDMAQIVFDRLIGISIATIESLFTAYNNNEYFFVLIVVVGAWDTAHRWWQEH